MDVREQFEAVGHLVLRGQVDAAALSVEFDRVMADAFVDESHVNSGSAGNRFRYVPMMSDQTPVSLATTRDLAVVAADLLGGPVLPGRTKATRYLTGSGWHRDSEVPLRSVGMLCYLEPLDVDSGALLVMPGSHRSSTPAPATLHAGIVLRTEPGDVIVFDEHLLHASTGGCRWRRQWRVDFVVDECATDPAADGSLCAYYASLHAPGWVGGYDVARYPSYGAAWRQLDSHWERRLAELGAFAAAAAEEQAAHAAQRP